MDSASADTVAAEAIKRFRNEVGTAFLAGIFSSPADLASQVAAAVASQGLSSSLSEMVLNRSDVSATSMGGFGTGHIFDTSVIMIKDMVRDVGKDRALVVELGDGDTWWSTRLFLLASLLQSLTPVRQLVFTGRGGRFAGMASPSALVEGFGARFPVLDLFSRQLRHGQATEDREREIDRQLGVWGQIFVGTGGPPPPASSTPLDLGSVPGLPLPTAERGIQIGVREELLRGWLGERLVDRCVRVDGRLSMSQVQQIVDCLLPDVPLEITPLPPVPPVPSAASEARAASARRKATKTAAPPPSPGPSPEGSTASGRGGLQMRVIDRDAFALELAREWVRTGLPRNPAI